MTTLREAAQHALEALEKAVVAFGPGLTLQQNAIAALRQALAEQKCPCGDRPADQCPGEWEPGCDLGANEKYAKVAEQAQPVAWMVKDEGLYWTEEAAIRRADQFVEPLDVVPLYTTPPAPQSLAEPVQPPYWGVFEGGNLHDFFTVRETAEEMAYYKGSHAVVGPIYTPPPAPQALTIERLRDALVASRVIDSDAVEDPDNYDDGVMLHRIEALFRRIT